MARMTKETDNIVKAFVGLPCTVRAYLVDELRLSKRLAAPVVRAAEVGLEDLLSPLRATDDYFEKYGIYKGIRRGVQDMCNLAHKHAEAQYTIAALVFLPYALQM